MNILVTGASGFLGQHLVKALSARGYNITALNSRSADLRHEGSMAPFNSRRYDLIFHLATWTQAGDFCLHHPGEQWIANQQINTHVLAWWQQYQSQAKLVSMGTSCAYAQDFELKEDNYLAGKPIESLFTYAMTKRMLYIGQQSLQAQFGMNHLSLVPSTLYGPGYHTDGRQMHFIFDLIRKILRGKLYGEDVVLWGDGQQRREVVLVDDFVQAVIYLAKTQQNQIINIGSGEEFTIRDFAHQICAQVGYEEKLILYDASRYVGAKSKCLDITKLKRLYPEFSPTPLSNGLSQTIAWFQEQKDSFLAPQSTSA
jgi:GDP-L-fucose synthase